MPKAGRSRPSHYCLLSWLRLVAAEIQQALVQTPLVDESAPDRLYGALRSIMKITGWIVHAQKDGKIAIRL